MALTALKNYLGNKLAHAPHMYAQLIRLKKHYNKEKVVYLNLIKKGDTVVEVGANVGYFTKLFAQIIGKSGKLHAFEPAPSTFSILEHNFNQSKSPCFSKLNCLGLSNHEGKATIHIPEGDPGQASLIPHSVGSWENDLPASTQDIILTTLDQYAKKENIQKLDFLKLDIEGAEFLALEGGQKILKAFRPIIHMEVCDHFLRDFNVQVNDLIELLVSLGYNRFFAYEENMKQPRDLRDLSKDDVEISKNIVCACSEDHGKRLKSMNWE